jgi:23S rRNA (guanosine2251-2'-O)-methyltransferase
MSPPPDRRTNRRPDRRPDRRSDAAGDRGPRRIGAGGNGRPAGRGASGPRPLGNPYGRQPSFDRSTGEGYEGRDRPAGKRPPYERPGFEGRPRSERPGDSRGGEGRPAREWRSPERFSGARPAFGRPGAGRPGAGRPSSARPSGGRSVPVRRAPALFRDADRPPRTIGARPTAPRDSSDGSDVDFRGDAASFAAAAPSDLIWGRHSAQATLESGRPIHRVWCTPEMRFSPRFLQLLREAKASGVLVEEVTWARLGQLTGGAVHQGIVLQPAAAETLDLASLIDGCRTIGEAPLLIAVDGLTDPQNLGAIVRSAEALGAHGMVLPQRRNAGLTGSVAKVAAGALEHLPVARVVNLTRSLEALKEEGYRVIGLAEEGTLSLEEVDLEGPLVVVTGSEGDGLSLLTRRTCDQLVRIPLRGATPSLNASVATALLLYEVARRGWMRGLKGSAPAPRIVRPSMPAPPDPDPAEPSPEGPGAEAFDPAEDFAPAEAFAPLEAFEPDPVPDVVPEDLQPQERNREPEALLESRTASEGASAPAPGPALEPAAEPAAEPVSAPEPEPNAAEASPSLYTPCFDADIRL